MQKKLLILLAFCKIITLNSVFEKVTYSFTNDPIDVIIPCHSKDAYKLSSVIAGIKKNVSNINRIIIIAQEKTTDKAEWFSESYFPFTKEMIALEITGHDTGKAQHLLTKPRSRIGWIYQQFLKLYAMYVIPDISSNMLIVDADTIFLRPVKFQDPHGAPLFNPGTEHHKPYFIHAKKVIPGFQKVFSNYSGISHHMLFQRPILDDLFDVIRKTNGIEPWKALCQHIDTNEGAGISEYEIYFNFAFLRSNQPKIRSLKWKNLKLQTNLSDSHFNYHRVRGYHYISCHTYITRHI